MMKKKFSRIVIFTIIICVVLSDCVFAASDNEGPKIESITIDKHEVTVGDELTVTVKVTDESGIKLSPSYVLFKELESGRTISVFITKSLGDDLYEGSISIKEDNIDGRYEFSHAVIYDVLSNYTTIYSSPNSDLFFVISGAASDNEGPKIESITIDKHEVTVGDELTVTVKVTDESGIKLSPSYVLFKELESGRTISAFITKSLGDDLYEGSISIKEDNIDGRYEFSHAVIYDVLSNYTTIYSSPNSDLFFVIYPNKELADISPLEGVYVFNETTTVSGRTFDGDIYIGKDAILTLNNCTVNGNIYVLGALKANSIKARSIYALSINLGGSVSSYTNGLAVVRGTCSISDFMASTRPVNSIPFRIDVSESRNGVLTIMGATADVTDLYINNKKATLINNKLIFIDEEFGDAQSVTLKWVTPFGYDITVAVDVDVITEPPKIRTYGGALSLEGDIGIKFYMVIPDEVLEDSSAYVTLNEKTIPISEGIKETVQGEEMYVFKYRVAAKEMNKDVVLHAYTGDGEAITLKRYTSGADITEQGYHYTVQKYITSVLKNASSYKADLVELVKAMSDYGSKAQTNFGYDTDTAKPIYYPEEISGVTLDDLTPYKREKITTDRTGISFTQFNLTLESETTTRLFFEVNEGSIDDYSFRVNGEAAEAKMSEYGYAVEIKNIAAKDLDEMYTVEVSDSEGVCLTVRCSALSYAYLVVKNEETQPEELVELVKALYRYNRKANEYFDK